MQESTSEKRENGINRQQLKKTTLEKFAHSILIKMAIDVVLLRLNSYKISQIWYIFSLIQLEKILLPNDFTEPLYTSVADLRTGFRT